ncbi:hypothetical protein HDU76_003466, partial [Blyttiomyces sp. JEL0837]
MPTSTEVNDHRQPARMESEMEQGDVMRSSSSSSKVVAVDIAANSIKSTTLTTAVKYPPSLHQSSSSTTLIGKSTSTTFGNNNHDHQFNTHERQHSEISITDVDDDEEIDVIQLSQSANNKPTVEHQSTIPTQPTISQRNTPSLSSGTSITGGASSTNPTPQPPSPTNPPSQSQTEPVTGSTTSLPRSILAEQRTIPTTTSHSSPPQRSTSPSRNTIDIFEPLPIDSDDSDIDLDNLFNGRSSRNSGRTGTGTGTGTGTTGIGRTGSRQSRQSRRVGLGVTEENRERVERVDPHIAANIREFWNPEVTAGDGISLPGSFFLENANRRVAEVFIRYDCGDKYFSDEMPSELEVMNGIQSFYIWFLLISLLTGIMIAVSRFGAQTKQELFFEKKLSRWNYQDRRIRLVWEFNRDQSTHSSIFYSGFNVKWCITVNYVDLGLLNNTGDNDIAELGLLFDGEEVEYLPAYEPAAHPRQSYSHDGVGGAAATGNQMTEIAPNNEIRSAVGGGGIPTITTTEPTTTTTATTDQINLSETVDEGWITVSMDLPRRGNNGIIPSTTTTTMLSNMPNSLSILGRSISQRTNHSATRVSYDFIQTPTSPRPPSYKTVDSRRFFSSGGNRHGVSGDGAGIGASGSGGGRRFNDDDGVLRDSVDEGSVRRRSVDSQEEREQPRARKGR